MYLILSFQKKGDFAAHASFSTITLVRLLIAVATDIWPWPAMSNPWPHAAQSKVLCGPV